jgi:hypothetical protein
MRRTVYEVLYEKLYQLIPTLDAMIADSTTNGFKLVDPKGVFMDLHVNILERGDQEVRISIAHYFTQNGDSIPDPDIEFRLIRRMKALEPLAIQMATGHYARVYVDKEMTSFRQSVRKDICSFMTMWFRNLKQQGHRIEEFQKLAA